MFGRRTRDPVETTPAEEPVRVGGKGRPTPTRKAAEAQRKAAARTVQSPREQRRQSRERMRAERAKARQALMTGDERNLPPRDRGPVRRLVRDVVDSRRTVAEYFLPFALAVVVLSFIQVPVVVVGAVYAWMVMLVVLVVDSVVLTRRVRREVAARYPDESRRGITAYALQRSMQMRRLRLPPPRVKPGGRPA